MIAFAPGGMTALLRAVADAAMQEAGADAALVRIAFGDRSASVARGDGAPAAGVAATPGQRFDAGSHAKMMTAVVVLQLAEAGRINLDARAADYLPAGIVAGIPNAGLAIVRQLLDITSGIPNHTDAVDAETGLPVFLLALALDRDRIFTAGDALQIARGMPANHPPGAQTHCTDTAYTLLGKLVTAVAGRSLADEFDARIFQPLGLGETSGQLAAATPERLGSYLVNPLTGQVESATEAGSRRHAPGEGSVVTTTADLITFLKALLVEKTLLCPDALAEMLGFHVVDSAPGAGGPVMVASVSAAALALSEGPDGPTFAAEGATLTLDRSLGSLTTRTVIFEDGSVLIVGDGRAGAKGDDRGNVTDILRDHPGVARTAS